MASRQYGRRLCSLPWIRTLRTLPAFAACVLISSAQALTLSKDNEAARDAALQWLQIVDAGKYQEAASQASHESHRLKSILNYLTNHRTPLGRADKRRTVKVTNDSNYSGLPNTRPYHTIWFRTSFAREPLADEVVVVAKIDCCWKIFDYEVNN